MEDKERNLNDQFDQLNTARVRGTKLSQFVDRFESGKANKALLEEVKTYLAKEKAKAEKPSKKAKAKAASDAPTTNRTKSWWAPSCGSAQVRNAETCWPCKATT